MFIGVGLSPEDISHKALQEIKQSHTVYLDFYTSLLMNFDQKQFETLIHKPITLLSREETEHGDKIIQTAQKHSVCFLTAGDPMIATTHIDLRLRAHNLGISTTIIHSSSIVTAASGLLGLQNYKFGRTTTLAFPEKNFFPTSPYTVIADNKKQGLHTLVLLDIKTDQHKYMTDNQGIQLLLQMEEQLSQNIITPETLLCVVARAGSSQPQVTANYAKTLLTQDFGPPLHTLIVPGNLHFIELQALQAFADLPPAIAKKIQKL